MQIHQKTLKNGLRIQAIELPETNVVTTLILTGAGSRYEDKKIAGISHFLEHMFFKGAKKYPTPKSVAEAVDCFGGEFNAFTGKEYAGYYVKSGKENIAKSLDVLSDMLLHSTFNEAEINKERGVILEEMAMYMDMPTYQISWDIESLIFGNQPLGRDQIGTKTLIENVSRQQFFDYQNSLYVPENMVITLAGGVDKNTLDLVEKYFEEMKPQKQTLDFLPFDANLKTEKFHLREKKTEQYHLSVGFRAISEQDKKYPSLKILATILGGNMSSRMFQNIREKKSLCYSIRTYIDEYTDTGLITTNAGVKLSDAKKAIEAIIAEYEDIRDHGFDQEEFLKAQNNLIGKTDLQTEDTENIAHHFAKNELLYKNQETFSEWKNKLKKVSQDEVMELAKTYFSRENLRIAGIGNTITAKDLKSIV